MNLGIHYTVFRHEDTELVDNSTENYGLFHYLIDENFGIGDNKKLNLYLVKNANGQYTFVDSNNRRLSYGQPFCEGEVCKKKGIFYGNYDVVDGFFLELADNNNRAITFTLGKNNRFSTVIDRTTYYLTFFPTSRKLLLLKRHLKAQESPESIYFVNNNEELVKNFKLFGVPPYSGDYLLTTTEWSNLSKDTDKKGDLPDKIIVRGNKIVPLGVK